MNVKAKRIETRAWGRLGQHDVVLVRLTNESGAFVEVTNYGATLVSVVVPDRFEKKENVVLGYPALRGYLSDTCYIGSTVGRFANRIGNGQFELDGELFNLDRNDGGNTNHGGAEGFHKKVFQYETREDEVTFRLFSRHLEGGFPGNVEFSVKYRWTDENELVIGYTATSDRKTVLNFTNHAYFNLSPGRDIFDHVLTIRGSKTLETNEEYIPTGKILPAEARAFEGNSIYERSLVKDGKITGLNTYYIFDRSDEDRNRPVCVLNEPHSGRMLEVFTTYPGVQLYTGDFLSSSEINNLSSFHKPFDGLCLECQYYPDSPNHVQFPSTLLAPGGVYDEKIIYRFSTKK